MKAQNRPNKTSKRLKGGYTGKYTRGGPKRTGQHRLDTCRLQGGRGQ
jgi:hypothetical protein